MKYFLTSLGTLNQFGTFESPNTQTTMNFTTKDGIKFELEIKGDDVIGYNTDREYLKDQELIFEGLWYELKEFGISESKYYIGNGDYDWDNEVVKEIAYSHLISDVTEAYEDGKYKLKIN